MNETTHNGKIARLPRNIRNELNHRLDDGEPGGRILEWLNTLSAVQTLLNAEFGGGRINAQNLSNWRKGGYQDWLKQQERRNLLRELTENAEELATDARGVEIANHLSAVLVAELAASARAALAAITDPAERCVREQEFLLTLVRVRRQDNLAGKLAIERERLARERAKCRREFKRRNLCAFKRRNFTANNFPRFPARYFGVGAAVGPRPRTGGADGGCRPWNHGQRGSGRRYRRPAARRAGERAGENARTDSRWCRWGQRPRPRVFAKDHPRSATGFVWRWPATTGGWRSHAARVRPDGHVPSGDGLGRVGLAGR